MTPASARSRILDAALQEFATRGYEAASTNAIAEHAGVAKGLVFHHFGSKEALFEQLFEREAQKLTDLVFASMPPGKVDLFERLHQLSLKKIELAAEHPLTSEFLIIAVTEAPPNVRPRIVAKQAAMLKTAWPRLLEGVDGSRLRDGTSLGGALETLSLMADGIERQLGAQLRSRAVPMKEVGAKLWRHFERLRDGLYR